MSKTIVGHPSLHTFPTFNGSEATNKVAVCMNIDDVIVTLNASVDISPIFVCVTMLSKFLVEFTANRTLKHNRSIFGRCHWSSHICTCNKCRLPSFPIKVEPRLRSTLGLRPPSEIRPPESVLIQAFTSNWTSDISPHFGHMRSVIVRFHCMSSKLRDETKLCHQLPGYST